MPHTPAMPSVQIAGKSVGKMGYGLMQLTTAQPPPPQEQSLAAMKAAADAGATLWSTAMFYNGLTNLELIAAFFKKYPEYKSKIVIVLKGGLVDFKPKFDPAKWREEIKTAQKILGDKRIDVFSLARLTVFSKVPLEDQLTALAALRAESLVDHIGASEVKATSLEAMQRHFPVACVEIEVNLWSYDQDIRADLAWATTHRVPVLAYSPIGRGILTGHWKTPDDIPEGSFLRQIPRFQGEAFYQNMRLVKDLEEMANRKGVETASLALAWVAQVGPTVVPIPGSSKVERVNANCAAASMVFSPEDKKEIDGLLEKYEIAGDRYPGFLQEDLML